MTVKNPDEVFDPAYASQNGNLSSLLLQFNTANYGPLRDGDTYRLGLLDGGSQVRSFQAIWDKIGQGVTLDFGYLDRLATDGDAYAAAVNVAAAGNLNTPIRARNHSLPTTVTMDVHCAELVTNGTFTGDATGWTTTGWTYGTNAIAHDSGNTTALYQDISAVAGYAYLVTYTLAVTVGTCTVSIGALSGVGLQGYVKSAISHMI